MDVPHEITGFAQGRGEVGLLDVHVKEVAENLHTADLPLAQPRRRVGRAVDEIRLVAVQRLVEEVLAAARGVRAEIGERLGEPRQGLLAGDLALRAALHRAEDRGRTERRGGVDDRADELAGLRADRRIGVRERPLVQHPAAAGADRGHREIVLREQRLDRRHVERAGIRRKNLDPIEAERGGLRARVGEAVPKHERPPARLRDEGDGDGGFHGKMAGALIGRLALSVWRLVLSPPQAR